MLWLALRGGAFRTSELTDDSRTNCWPIEQFLGPRFTIDETARTVSAV